MAWPWPGQAMAKWRLSEASGVALGSLGFPVPMALGSLGVPAPAQLGHGLARPWPGHGQVLARPDQQT